MKSRENPEEETFVIGSIKDENFENEQSKIFEMVLNKHKKDFQSEFYPVFKIVNVCKVSKT